GARALSAARHRGHRRSREADRSAGRRQGSRVRSHAPGAGASGEAVARRRRAPAHGDSGGSLSGRGEATRRGRCTRCGHLRASVFQGQGFLRVLSEHAGLQGLDRSRPGRARAQTEQRLLSVPAEAGRRRREVIATPTQKRSTWWRLEALAWADLLAGLALYLVI